jgi:hypothetical protein
MALNPISFRIPAFDLSTEQGRLNAHRWTTQGIVDLNQAIYALAPKLDSTAATANAVAQNSSVASGVSSFNSETGAVVYFPTLGKVNNQLGVAAYTTQTSDNGAKIVVGDSSAVAVTLNSSVAAPWFCVIDNDSSSVANLSPTSGLLYGEKVIQPGGFGIVSFDGFNFWCGATGVMPETFTPVSGEYLTGYSASSGAFSAGGMPIATDSSMGIVEPEGVTIGIDSGMIYTFVTADSGAPSSVPVTPGNPFYFDSSISPWQGYVWFQNAWRKFS